jgi:hypothetical protein
VNEKLEEISRSLRRIEHLLSAASPYDLTAFSIGSAKFSKALLSVSNRAGSFNTDVKSAMYAAGSREACLGLQTNLKNVIDGGPGFVPCFGLFELYTCLVGKDLHMTMQSEPA